MEEHIGSVTVVGCEEPGILAANYEADGSVRFVSGLSFLILQDLRFILNFTTRDTLVHNFFPKDDTEYNRTSNDSLGYQIVNRNADIAIGWLYHLKYRLKYGVPLTAFSTERYEAYFIQPSEKVASKFAKPFQTDVVLCFLVTVFIVSILYTLINDDELLFLCKNNRPLLTSASITRRIYDGSFLALTLICQKEFKVYTSRNGTKLTLLIGTLLCLFVYLLYSAAILSYFLVDINVIQSFSDIFKHKFSICATPGLESVVLRSQTGLKGAHSVTFPKMEYSESLKRLFTGKHVHLGTHDDIGLKFTELGIPHHEVCQNISYVKIPGSVHVGFYVRSSYPHRHAFNTKILKIKERGLIFRYRSAFKSDFAIRCSEIKKRYDDDLGLNEIEQPFCILMYTLIGSFLLLLTEVGTNKKFGAKCKS